MRITLSDTNQVIPYGAHNVDAGTTVEQLVLGLNADYNLDAVNVTIDGMNATRSSVLSEGDSVTLSAKNLKAASEVDKLVEELVKLPEASDVLKSFKSDNDPSVENGDSLLLSIINEDREALAQEGREIMKGLFSQMQSQVQRTSKEVEKATELLKNAKAEEVSAKYVLEQLAESNIWPAVAFTGQKGQAQHFADRLRAAVPDRKSSDWETSPKTETCDSDVSEE